MAKRDGEQLLLGFKLSLSPQTRPSKHYHVEAVDFTKAFPESLTMVKYPVDLGQHHNGNDPAPGRPSPLNDSWRLTADMEGHPFG